MEDKDLDLVFVDMVNNKKKLKAEEIEETQKVKRKSTKSKKNVKKTKTKVKEEKETKEEVKEIKNIDEKKEEKSALDFLNNMKKTSPIKKKNKIDINDLDFDTELELIDIDEDYTFDIKKIVKGSVKSKDNPIIDREIKGELYRNKKVPVKTIKGVAFLAAGILTALLANKIIKYELTTYSYKIILNKYVNSELSYTELKEYLKQIPITDKEHYENYKIALDQLDDSNYTINGLRKDGNHNESIPFDPGSLYNLSDKDKDAIDMAVLDEVEEFKRGGK